MNHPCTPVSVASMAGSIGFGCAIGTYGGLFFRDKLL
jgi:hypothetical protein